MVEAALLSENLIDLPTEEAPPTLEIGQMTRRGYPPDPLFSQLRPARRDEWVKRLFDVFCALVGLLLALPLFLVIAVLIKIDSPGPVLYRGARTGRFGQPFIICKFRTMKVTSEGKGGLTTALNDPRVTRIGRILRRRKLDELPQLINVLKGEMSIVGPRPEMPEYTRLYNHQEKIILSVRPGITDFASLEFINLASAVGEKNADAVYFEKIWARKNQLRVKYAREHTFFKDMVILWRTVGALLKSGSRRLC